MNFQDNHEFKDFKNKKVLHIKFGTGIVKSNSDRVIEIQFDDSSEERRFIYPDAFERFLRFQDPLLNDEVQNKIKTRNE